MFNLISSLASTTYLYIIAGLLTLVVVFGGLSYYFKGVADQRSAELKVAQSANSTLQESLDKKTQSCDITDKQLAEYQSQTNTIVSEKNTKLSAIDALPNKPLPVAKTTSTKAQQDETDVVTNLDSKLPQSLIDLLQQSNSAVQGSVASHP